MEETRVPCPVQPRGTTCGVLRTCSPSLGWGSWGAWPGVTPPLSAPESVFLEGPTPPCFLLCGEGLHGLVRKTVACVSLQGGRGARGSGVRPGLGPFDAWAGVGACARIKRPQSCPQPSASVVCRGRLLPQPHLAGGVAGAPLNGLKGLFMRPSTLPSCRGLCPASSSPLSLEKMFRPRLAPVAQLHFPYSLPRSDLRWGEGDRAPSSPGASALRSAPLAEPSGAALWGLGWHLLGASGRGGST